MGKTGDTFYTVADDQKGYSRYIYPDQLNFDKEPFATIIPIRQVTFKVHKTESLANAALSLHKQGAKYRQVSGIWVKVWEFYEPINCEKCGTKLDQSRDGIVGYFGIFDGWHRSPLHKGSQIFAPFLCARCFEQEAEIVRDRNKARRWYAEQRRRADFDAKV